MNWKIIKSRFSNPFFRLAVAGFTYNILKSCGLELDESLWKTGIDIASYLFIGAGVYATFPDPDEDKQGDPPTE